MQLYIKKMVSLLSADAGSSVLPRTAALLFAVGVMLGLVSVLCETDKDAEGRAGASDGLDSGGRPSKPA